MHILRPGLSGDDPLPRLGFLRGIFLANHLASTDNSTRTTKRQNTTKTNNTQKGAQINMLRYTTDRARPGLVALYDIWPGNGAGQFLQPRSPHVAYKGLLLQKCYMMDTLPVTQQTAIIR